MITISEQAQEQWYRRRTQMDPSYALHETPSLRVCHCRPYDRRVTRNSFRAGVFILFAAIIVSPTLEGVSRAMGVGSGVLAAPCVTGNTTTVDEEGGRGGGAATFNVSVTPNTDLDLTSIFNCEGGQFQVAWSGAVNISGTIHIGLGTTVKIVGDSSSNIIFATDSTSERDSNTTGGGGNDSTSNDPVDDLTAALAIPSGLTSAVVGVGSSKISADTDKTLSFGPIFYVEGGQLFLENMAIRGGFVANSTSGPTISGAGIHAVDSNLTATACEFEDNFAEFLGGGVFANRSNLVVVDSVFRRCRAGFHSKADDEDVEGAGGGIGVENTDVLIDGCLFEDCYASKKGGGMHQGVGQTSVLGSVFYNNSAGSDNIEDETEIGEGASLSFTTCFLSFDGQSTCEVNDTIIAENNVGRKGGAVAIGTGDAPSHIEFHRCLVANSTTGLYIEDDPQGEGGAFAVGRGITLVLSDCVLTGNYCGNKGGVITLSSGGDWDLDPGPTVILRNSTFKSNMADLGNAAVVYLGEFSSLVVAGDTNVFEGNTCGGDGAVFGGTVDSNITVEGGVFKDNEAKEDGGVMWTKGRIEIFGGEFVDNKASGKGGVIISADDSTTILAGGMFEENEALDGGVVHVGDGCNLWVEGGEFSENKAGSSGGAFSVSEGGNIQITGGQFSLNEADFGGFLYKEGDGTATCEGATIRLNQGVDGGAIYAVEDAVLDWACDLIGNSALAGPAIYARDDTTVVLRGVSLIDNAVARGSVIFVVDSDLKTYQVKFNDTTASSDLSAVQVDEDSTYMAEDTSFEGFQGEAVVFSEGILYLDDCDFSGSNASQLVFAQPKSTVVIRNTILGDRNYMDLAAASSRAGQLPTASSLTNANITCRTITDGGSGGSSPCTEGSVCLQGDLGVYCQCYPLRSSSDQEQRCVAGESAALSLAPQRVPEITFYPQMLEGDLLLSYGTSAASSAASASSTSTTATNTTDSSASPDVSGEEREGVASSSQAEGRNNDTFSSTNSNSSIDSNNANISSRGVDLEGTVGLGGSQTGVVWNVSALKQLSFSGASMMDWTVFPSSGLLLPGKSIILRVVTLPSTNFDGTTSATFVADSIGAHSSSTTSNNGQQEQLSSASSSESQDSDDPTVQNTSKLGSNNASTASFDVTFYHCETGQVWNSTSTSIETSSDGDMIEGCQLCSDVVEGEAEGVTCDEPGATIATLPVEEGYWRAARTVTFIRECPNPDACKGGSTVANVQEYCNDGYEGPECAVCVSGYGRGAANECHRCTTGFKASMYFVIAMASICSLVVIALLATYLVGGRGAVSSTVASTKEYVRMLQRRGSGFMTRKECSGRVDFTSPGATGATRSNDFPGHEIEMSRSFGTKSQYVRSRRITSSTGIDPRSRRNLKGSSRSTRRVSGNLFSPSRPGNVRRVASERPGPTMETSGLAAMAPTQYTVSPPCATLPAEEKGETLTRTGNNSHGDNTDAPGTSSHHHANLSSFTNQQATSDIRSERVNEGQPNIEGRLSESTANVQQPHLRQTLPHRASEIGVEVERSRKSREPSMSRERNRAEEGNGDGTAAGKIGKVLTGLPLSKLKIVIVVWQISTAFSNITNVAYPPIYEKFLSFIGVFSLDLTWILSAACLTTDVDFYDKLLMVTIGPLIVLGLLRVTFRIGSRPLIPVVTDVPTIRHAPRRSQSYTQVLQKTEPYGSRPALQRANTTDNSSHDVPRVLELPSGGPVLQRGRRSGSSEDTIALSRSERQVLWVGASAARTRIVANTSNDSFESSGIGRPATSVGISAAQHRPAGTEAGEDLQPSGTVNRSTNTVDATVDDQRSVKGYDRGRSGVQAGPSFVRPLPSTGRPLDRPERSLWSVWKAGPGNEADPEQDHLWGLFARHTTMTLILLYLVYSQVSTVVFQTFACEPFPEINKHYLRADQRIECYTATHIAYRTYAAVMIFVYPLGIPAAFYFLLSRKHSSINPPIDRTLKEQRSRKHVVQEKINKRDNDLSIAPTSFLWNAYYPNRYYYEVFECLRRLVLTGLLVFLVPDTPGQVAFSCVFAFASLLAFELQRPHMDPIETQLYRTGCLVIFFTNFLALMIKADVADEHSTGSAFYSVVLIMVNVMFFLSIWWNTWATIKLTFTRRGFQGAIVGADVVGDDIVDKILGPNKKKRRIMHATNEHASDIKSRGAEQPPAWEEAPNDIESRFDSTTSTRSGVPLLP